MGFCSDSEYEEFMVSVPKFEEMLVHSGIKLMKYYLDISKTEQKQRLADRARDPLKQWKISPIDSVALKHWKEYSAARDVMLLRTHTRVAPWQVIRADNKRLARLNIMRDLLSRLHYTGKNTKLIVPDRNIAFEFTPDSIDDKELAR
jgi:polyphosphate kinase 2 (PPK2 family)